MWNTFGFKIVGWSQMIKSSKTESDAYGIGIDRQSVALKRSRALGFGFAATSELLDVLKMMKPGCTQVHPQWKNWTLVTNAWRYDF